jgi:hypothetical protein
MKIVPAVGRHPRRCPGVGDDDGAPSPDVFVFIIVVAVAVLIADAVALKEEQSKERWGARQGRDCRPPLFLLSSPLPSLNF